MLSDSEIKELIIMPKKIIKKSPHKILEKKSSTERECNLDLQSLDPQGNFFSVFIRQNINFTELFSIGLCYLPEDKILGRIQLIRYNGAHDNGAHYDKNRDKDGHYGNPHIHWITTEEMKSAVINPQPKHRKITDKYTKFDEALAVFFEDMKIENHLKHFRQITMSF